MSRRAFVVCVLSTVLLGACQPATAPREAVNAGGTSEVPATLVGDWRVAGIDGRPLAGDRGIAVRIDKTLIAFDPRCLGFVWTYQYRAGALRTAKWEPERPDLRCLASISAEQSALGTAISASTRAERTPENGVLLSGGGHSVLLFSQ